MAPTRDPGRVAGLWYILLVFSGPLRLVYIPTRLFVHDNATATANNIAAHQWLFRLGTASDLVGALILIGLVMAFYRLFKGVDTYLAVLVVILGGVMPALLLLVQAAIDGAALLAAQGPAFLSAFDKPQRDALTYLLVRLNDSQVVAAEILWGAWLLPLALLVYRSRFMPRFLGVWLVVNGVAYIIMSFAGVLAPQYRSALFLYFQPALFGELALILWLLVKGARPPAETTATSFSM